MTDAAGSATLSRTYNAVLAVVVATSLVLEVVVVVQNHVVALPTALLRLVSYFTIQSNVLVLVAAASLAVRPDRDGPGWRVLRLDALLGITVTGIVYVTVLAGEQHLEGMSKVADTGVHYVAPIATVVGWLVFGPRPRIEARVVWLALIWPVLWLVYTLIHGAIGGWYPYPFIDVTSHGYARTLLNAVLVTVLMLALAGLFLWGDRRLPSRPAATRGAYQEAGQ